MLRYLSFATSAWLAACLAFGCSSDAPKTSEASKAEAKPSEPPSPLKSDILNMCDSESKSGALDLEPAARAMHTAVWLANNLQTQEARELSASYSDLVLNAMREVETNLRSEYELGQELDHAKASVQSLKGAENISKDRYLRGIESLSDYLDSQQLLYTAEQNLILTQQAKWNTRIGLYLALGGDWFSAGYHPGCRKTGGTLFKEMKDQDNEQNEN